METRKRYYEDSNLCVFDAVVMSCEPVDKGYAVALDQTAFYPEGGGQACDVGTLGPVQVLDVREKGETIIHLCDGPLPVGQQVRGKLDWARRLDQMQQHTGEHIVSGLINRQFGHHNVGFHVGADVITIDFDGPIPQEALAQIERQANEAIWMNLPVDCSYPSEEVLQTIPYRSKKALPWPVRIVQVPGYDICACCGVHVASTGSIGLIKLLSCVKFHQGVRIEMVCGGRALRLFDRVYEQNRQVSQAFSAKILETGEAARKMNEALASEKFRATGLEKQLFAGIAEKHREQGDVLYFGRDLSANGIRELAVAIAEVCGGTAAVFSGDDEAGYGVCLVNRQADVKELGRQMSLALNGRGGGKPGFFQGSVKADQGRIRQFFA